jgi:glycosyltransferase involved in cell wall biosynthesis
LVTPANWPILLSLLNVLFRHHGNRPGPFLKALLLVPRLVEVVAELRRDPPDVVHAFWGHYPSLVFPLLARFVPQCHRSMFLGAYDLTSHLIPYTQYSTDFCDSVWTHSEENRSALIEMKIDPQRLGVVHRGIPLDLANGPKPKKEPFRICTAANLQKEKNIDRILEVFGRVLTKIPEAHLVIAGDGAERQALERLAVQLDIDSSVTFTGYLRRDMLFGEMARSSVFLFLSTKVSERLPNVVKEAMLAECHCIVSETPGIRELITPGETGDIVADADPEAVADRIVAVMNSGSAEVGKAAAGFVRRNLSSEAAMGRYVEGWRAEIVAAGQGEGNRRLPVR